MERPSHCICGQNLQWDRDALPMHLASPVKSLTEVWTSSVERCCAARCCATHRWPGTLNSKATRSLLARSKPPASQARGDRPAAVRVSRLVQALATSRDGATPWVYPSGLHNKVAIGPVAVREHPARNPSAPVGIFKIHRAEQERCSIDPP